ncbi:uroporphyrinogen-III synthase [Paroceanicella profunda]|uniref:Uroporphyrinogen-III synthase n=1 Tax=Paroceanicella profunda TaxID=2579971 RepID=A0A5B8FGN8_9RHOB|nr:uroporphyrinogen-III synthase [Paroceanicella profunda]QDL91461.1 uroporphyrinogen-III synthase [Paroceanicella profunda]
MPDSSAELLITRPEPQAAGFAQRVAEAWPGAFRPLLMPLTEIVDEPADISLDGVQALLFTSANGVRAFCALSAARHLPALCVGDATAEAAAAAGFAAESAQGDASALATLAARAALPGGGDYLWPHGRSTAGDIAGALAAEGVGVREAVVYDARPVAGIPASVAARLEEGGLRVATFLSPRAARLFAGLAETALAQGQGWALGATAALCISRAASAPLSGLGFERLCLADRPDAEAVIEGLGQFVGR